MDLARKQYDLTEGAVWKQLMRFAMPILLGIVFQSLYTTADAVIIGRFAGKEALAAIESVYTLTKLPVNFFVGLSSGATIIISQLFGAKDMDGTSDACHTALLFAFIGGLVLSAAGCAMSGMAAGWVQVPESIRGEATSYLLIFFGGMAASMTYNIGAGIFRALGNSKTPFYYLLVANILNVLLDLVFVGALGWGVRGAALTTVLAQILSAALIVVALFRTELPCRITLAKLRFHKKHLSAFFRLGLPVGIQATLYPISNTIVHASVNTFGVDSIAAWAVSGKLDFLVWFISDAFCTAVSTFVAQNHGAGLHHRARKGVWVGSVIAMAAVALVGCALFFWCAPLARLLVDDEAVVEITANIARFFAPLYVLYVLGDILPGAIRGAGESFKPMLITLVCTCATRVLWVFFVVPLRPELTTVLGCYPVSWALTSIAFVLYYVHRNATM